jgi:hypothetical protein
MSFLSRHEIGRSIAMTPSEAAKARRVVDDIDRLFLTLRGSFETDPGHVHLECVGGINASLHDHGISGISIHVADERDVRPRKMALHIHGRPAHFPDRGEDPMSVATLAVGLARQCVRVASSKKALPPRDIEVLTGSGARRHAMRLAAEAVARGHVPTGEVNEESRVNHPWGDAPSIASLMLGGERMDGVSTAPLERLMEIAVIGEPSDRDLHIRGHLRSACLLAVASDPLEMMRLLGELEDLRAVVRDERPDGNSPPVT